MSTQDQADSTISSTYPDQGAADTDDNEDKCFRDTRPLSNYLDFIEFCQQSTSVWSKKLHLSFLHRYVENRIELNLSLEDRIRNCLDLIYEGLNEADLIPQRFKLSKRANSAHDDMIPDSTGIHEEYTVMSESSDNELQDNPSDSDYCKSEQNSEKDLYRQITMKSDTVDTTAFNSEYKMSGLKQNMKRASSTNKLRPNFLNIKAGSSKRKVYPIDQDTIIRNLDLIKLNLKANDSNNYVQQGKVDCSSDADFLQSRLKLNKILGSESIYEDKHNFSTTEQNTDQARKRYKKIREPDCRKYSKDTSGKMSNTTTNNSNESLEITEIGKLVKNYLANCDKKTKGKTDNTGENSASVESEQNNTENEDIEVEKKSRSKDNVAKIIMPSIPIVINNHAQEINKKKIYTDIQHNTSLTVNDNDNDKHDSSSIYCFRCSQYGHLTCDCEKFCSVHTDGIVNKVPQTSNRLKMNISEKKITTISEDSVESTKPITLENSFNANDKNFEKINDKSYPTKTDDIGMIKEALKKKNIDDEKIKCGVGKVSPYSINVNESYSFQNVTQNTLNNNNNNNIVNVTKDAFNNETITTEKLISPGQNIININMSSTFINSSTDKSYVVEKPMENQFNEATKQSIMEQLVSTPIIMGMAVQNTTGTLVDQQQLHYPLSSLVNVSYPNMSHLPASSLIPYPTYSSLPAADIYNTPSLTGITLQNSIVTAAINGTPTSPIHINNCMTDVNSQIDMEVVKAALHSINSSQNNHLSCSSYSQRDPRLGHTRDHRLDYSRDPRLENRNKNDCGIIVNDKCQISEKVNPVQNTVISNLKEGTIMDLKTTPFIKNSIHVETVTNKSALRDPRLRLSNNIGRVPLTTYNSEPASNSISSDETANCSANKTVHYLHPNIVVPVVANILNTTETFNTSPVQPTKNEHNNFGEDKNYFADYKSLNNRLSSSCDNDDRNGNCSNNYYDCHKPCNERSNSIERCNLDQPNYEDGYSKNENIPHIRNHHYSNNDKHYWSNDKSNYSNSEKVSIGNKHNLPDPRPYRSVTDHIDTGKRKMNIRPFNNDTVEYIKLGSNNCKRFDPRERSKEKTLSSSSCKSLDSPKNILGIIKQNDNSIKLVPEKTSYVNKETHNVSKQNCDNSQEIAKRRTSFSTFNSKQSTYSINKQREKESINNVTETHSKDVNINLRNNSIDNTNLVSPLENLFRDDDKNKVGHGYRIQKLQQFKIPKINREHSKNTTTSNDKSEICKSKLSLVENSNDGKNERQVKTDDKSDIKNLNEKSPRKNLQSNTKDKNDIKILNENKQRCKSNQSNHKFNTISNPELTDTMKQYTGDKILNNEFKIDTSDNTKSKNMKMNTAIKENIKCSPLQIVLEKADNICKSLTDNKLIEILESNLDFNTDHFDNKKCDDNVSRFETSDEMISVIKCSKSNGNSIDDAINEKTSLDNDVDAVLLNKVVNCDVDNKVEKISTLEVEINKNACCNFNNLEKSTENNNCNKELDVKNDVKVQSVNLETNISTVDTCNRNDITSNGISVTETDVQPSEGKNVKQSAAHNYETVQNYTIIGSNDVTDNSSQIIPLNCDRDNNAVEISVKETNTNKNSSNKSCNDLEQVTTKSNSCNEKLNINDNDVNEILEKTGAVKKVIIVESSITANGFSQVPTSKDALNSSIIIPTVLGSANFSDPTSTMSIITESTKQCISDNNNTAPGFTLLDSNISTVCSSAGADALNSPKIVQRLLENEFSNLADQNHTMSVIAAASLVIYAFLNKLCELLVNIVSARDLDVNELNKPVELNNHVENNTASDDTQKAEIMLSVKSQKSKKNNSKRRKKRVKGKKINDKTQPTDSVISEKCTVEEMNLTKDTVTNVTEPTSVNVPLNRVKPRKFASELDRLHQDIKEMTRTKNNILVTSSVRSCRLQKSISYSDTLKRTTVQCEKTFVQSTSRKRYAQSYIESSNESTVSSDDDTNSYTDGCSDDTNIDKKEIFETSENNNQQKINGNKNINKKGVKNRSQKLEGKIQNQPEHIDLKTGKFKDANDVENDRNSKQNKSRQQNINKTKIKDEEKDIVTSLISNKKSQRNKHKLKHRDITCDNGDCVEIAKHTHRDVLICNKNIIKKQNELELSSSNELKTSCVSDDNVKDVDIENVIKKEVKNQVNLLKIKDDNQTESKCFSYDGNSKLKPAVPESIRNNGRLNDAATSRFLNDDTLEEIYANVKPCPKRFKEKYMMKKISSCNKAIISEDIESKIKRTIPKIILKKTDNDYILKVTGGSGNFNNNDKNDIKQKYEEKCNFKITNITLNDETFDNKHEAELESDPLSIEEQNNTSVESNKVKVDVSHDCSFSEDDHKSSLTEKLNEEAQSCLDVSYDCGSSEDDHKSSFLNKLQKEEKNCVNVVHEFGSSEHNHKSASLNKLQEEVKCRFDVACDFSSSEGDYKSLSLDKLQEEVKSCLDEFEKEERMDNNRDAENLSSFGKSSILPVTLSLDKLQEEVKNYLVEYEKEERMDNNRDAENLSSFEKSSILPVTASVDDQKTNENNTGTNDTGKTNTNDTGKTNTDDTGKTNNNGQDVTETAEKKPRIWVRRFSQDNFNMVDNGLTVSYPVISNVSSLEQSDLYKNLVPYTTNEVVAYSEHIQSDRQYSLLPSNPALARIPRHDAIILPSTQATTYARTVTSSQPPVSLSNAIEIQQIRTNNMSTRLPSCAVNTVDRSQKNIHDAINSTCNIVHRLPNKSNYPSKNPELQVTDVTIAKQLAPPCSSDRINDPPTMQQTTATSSTTNSDGSSSGSNSMLEAILSNFLKKDEINVIRLTTLPNDSHSNNDIRSSVLATPSQSFVAPHQQSNHFMNFINNGGNKAVGKPSVTVTASRPLRHASNQSIGTVVNNFGTISSSIPKVLHPSQVAVKTPPRSPTLEKRNQQPAGHRIADTPRPLNNVLARNNVSNPQSEINLRKVEINKNLSAHPVTLLKTANNARANNITPLSLYTQLVSSPGNAAYVANQFIGSSLPISNNNNNNNNNSNNNNNNNNSNNSNNNNNNSNKGIKRKSSYNQDQSLNAKKTLADTRLESIAQDKNINGSYAIKFGTSSKSNHSEDISFKSVTSELNNTFPKSHSSEEIVDLTESSSCSLVPQVGFSITPTISQFIGLSSQLSTFYNNNNNNDNDKSNVDNNRNENNKKVVKRKSSDNQDLSLNVKRAPSAHKTTESTVQDRNINAIESRASPKFNRFGKVSFKSATSELTNAFPKSHRSEEIVDLTESSSCSLVPQVGFSITPTISQFIGPSSQTSIFSNNNNNNDNDKSNVDNNRNDNNKKIVKRKSSDNLDPSSNAKRAPSAYRTTETIGQDININSIKSQVSPKFNRFGNVSFKSVTSELNDTSTESCRSKRGPHLDGSGSFSSNKSDKVVEEVKNTLSTTSIIELTTSTTENHRDDTVNRSVDGVVEKVVNSSNGSENKSVIEIDSSRSTTIDSEDSDGFNHEHIDVGIAQSSSTLNTCRLIEDADAKERQSDNIIKSKTDETDVVSKKGDVINEDKSKSNLNSFASDPKSNTNSSLTDPGSDHNSFYTQSESNLNLSSTDPKFDLNSILSDPKSDHQLVTISDSPSSNVEFTAQIGYLINLLKCAAAQCLFSTNKKDLFLEHINDHIMNDESAVSCKYSKDYMKCIYCGVSQDTSSSLWSHIVKCHSNCCYQCSYCNFRSCRPSYVGWHQALNHPKERINILVPENITCSDDQFKMQKIPHSIFSCFVLPYVCSRCYTQCITAKSFQNHLVEKHRRFRNFKCLTCDEPLFSENYISHMKQHDICTYQCIYCVYGTEGEGEMRAHLTVNHFSSFPMAVNRTDPTTTVFFQNRKEYMTVKDHVTNESIVLVNLDTYIDVKDRLHQVHAGSNATCTITSLDEHTAKITTVDLPDKRFSDSTKLSTVTVHDEYSSNSNNNSNNVLTTCAGNTAEIENAVSSLLSSYDDVRDTLTTGTDIADCSNFSSTCENDTTIIEDEAEGEKEEECTTTVETEKDGQQQTVSLTRRHGDTVIKFDHLGIECGRTDCDGLSGRDLYRCGIEGCSFSSEISNDLADHLVKCVKKLTQFGGTMSCPHCSIEKFSHASRYLTHLRVHGVARFICSLCSFRSALQNLMSNHMKTRHNSNQNVVRPINSSNTNINTDYFVFVPSSSEGFKNSAGMKTGPKKLDHPSLVHSFVEAESALHNAVYRDEIVCGICGNFVSKTRNLILGHIKQCELKNSNSESSGNNVGESDTSDLCNYIPNYVPAMDRFRCSAPDCNYISSNAKMLKNHFRALHKDLKTFRCPHCDPSVKSSQKIPLTLIPRHMNLHDRTLYKCPKCLYCHSASKYVIRHIQSNHPSVKRDVLCVRGGDDNSEALIINEESSSDDETESTSRGNNKSGKRWNCCICTYTTAIVSNIQKHCGIQHHCTTKLFKCCFCSFISNYENILLAHYDSYHPLLSRNYVSIYKKIKPAADKRCPRMTKVTSAGSSKANTNKRTKPFETAPPPSIYATKAERKKSYGRPFLPESCYRCPNCDFKSTHEERFKTHMYREYNYNKWACQECNKLGFNKNSLIEHARIQHCKKDVITALDEDTSLEKWIDDMIRYQTYAIDKFNKGEPESESSSDDDNDDDVCIVSEQRSIIDTIDISDEDETLENHLDNNLDCLIEEKPVITTLETNMDSLEILASPDSNLVSVAVEIEDDDFILNDQIFVDVNLTENNLPPVPVINENQEMICPTCPYRNRLYDAMMSHIRTEHADMTRYLGLSNMLSKIKVIELEKSIDIVDSPSDVTHSADGEKSAIKDDREMMCPICTFKDSTYSRMKFHIDTEHVDTVELLGLQNILDKIKSPNIDFTANDNDNNFSHKRKLSTDNTSLSDDGCSSSENLENHLKRKRNSI